MKMSVDRRSFLGLGSVATVSALAGCVTGSRRSVRHDPSLTVFVSDVHAKRGEHTFGRFERVVGRILDTDPLPARVVCLGDLAWCYGHRADYVDTRPVLDRLADAGIELTFGMGNHDRRENFLAVWPEYRQRMLVQDRIVSETSLGACDLVLLDTLWEDHADETRMTQVNGELIGTQLAWLTREAPKRTRPFFLAGHHPVRDITHGDWKALNDFILSLPNCIGWLNGHDHTWKDGLLTRSDREWDRSVFRRWLGFPSTGSWGDIGFVVMKTEPGMARAELVLLEHFYPKPGRRTWLDEEIVAEKRCSACTFRW